MPPRCSAWLRSADDLSEGRGRSSQSRAPIGTVSETQSQSSTTLPGTKNLAEKVRAEEREHVEAGRLYDVDANETRCSRAARSFSPAPNASPQAVSIGCC